MRLFQNSVLRITCLLIFFAAMGSSMAMQRIAPNHKAIRYEGVLFPDITGERARLDRFSEAYFKSEGFRGKAEKARTQSCVSIRFKTNSPKVKVIFSKREDAQQRKLVFGVFEDGAFLGDFKTEEFEINRQANKTSEISIVLPILYGVDFLGLEIEDDARLFDLPADKRKSYVAIGNSITHGVGQDASYQTYPYQLAKAKDWKVYNLGIGGSKVAYNVATQLKHIQADVITVLWGHNDWAFNDGDFPVNTLDNYRKMIQNLRVIQPQAQIYCILPTYTKVEKPRFNELNYSHEKYRTDIRKIIESQIKEGDQWMHIIDGYALTDVSMLKDNVHFNITGAAEFARKMESLIHAHSSCEK